MAFHSKLEAIKGRIAVNHDIIRYDAIDAYMIIIIIIIKWFVSHVKSSAE